MCWESENEERAQGWVLGESGTGGKEKCKWEKEHLSEASTGPEAKSVKLYEGVKCSWRVEWDEAWGKSHWIFESGRPLGTIKRDFG